MNDEEIKKELDDLFEKHWALFPVYPIAEQHAQHKVVAKNAFLAGYIEGIQKVVNSKGL